MANTVKQFVVHVRLEAQLVTSMFNTGNKVKSLHKETQTLLYGPLLRLVVNSFNDSMSFFSWGCSSAMRAIRWLDCQNECFFKFS